MVKSEKENILLSQIVIYIHCGSGLPEFQFTHFVNIYKPQQLTILQGLMHICYLKIKITDSDFMVSCEITMLFSLEQ